MASSPPAFVAPTHTANGEFTFSAMTLWGQTLDELIQVAHRKLSDASGWEYRPLAPGQFGYDNMAMSVGRVTASPDPAELARFAELVHDGWVANYTYWRDSAPWTAAETDPSAPKYFKPYNPLGDARRNALAVTSLSDLPVDERQKDELIAQTLLDIRLAYNANLEVMVEHYMHDPSPIELGTLYVGSANSTA